MLMYHSVPADKRDRFERQMAELVRVGRPVFADQADSETVGEYLIGVTFDDGFASVLHNALPVLSARAIPATIFIPTGYTGGRPGWINDPMHESVDDAVMSEEEIRKLPEKLISVGSHTVSHPDLTKLDGESAREELTDSKRKLESILQREINMLSLPYGSFNEELASLSKAAGYERVFLNVPTRPALSSQPYKVGRIHVSPNDWMIEYRLKLMGAYEWLSYVIPAKQKIHNVVRSYRKN